MGVFFWENMFVLSLCRQFCPDWIPSNLGERLGEGADGEVFSLTDDPQKVLKLGIIYEHHNGELFYYYNQIDKVLDYMIAVRPSAYARVYEHGYLGLYSRKMPFWRKGVQKFIIYYYSMEKLQKISEDESKVFHSILSHEDRGIEKNYPPDKIQEMLEGLSVGLDFDAKKVTLFCDNISGAAISHLDIHVRNIMKDDANNFKLIDIDRIELEKEHVK